METSPRVGPPPTGAGNLTVSDITAFADHVAGAAEEMATNFVDAVQGTGSGAEPKASVSSVDGGAGEPGASVADPTSVEPSVSSEDEAKLLEGQQRLAGFGVVSPEGKPPYRGPL